MDCILWLARIFGPFFLIMGLWALLRNDDVQRTWNSIKNTPPLFYLGGVLNLLIGFTMLSTYHAWTFGIPVLLTLVGYFMILRGVCVLFVPNKVIEYTEKLMTYGNKPSFIPLTIGLLLTGYAIFA